MVKMSPTNPWLGKCLKNVLPHHSGCVFGLPAAGNSPRSSWMSLCVVRPSSSRHVVERERDVVLDVEGAVGVVGPHAREPQALGLVAGVEVVLRVVDRVEADHALVDVRPGVVHPVVVEPEERLLLPVVAAGRPVQVQVVHEGLDRVTGVLRTEQVRVVRVAVRLGRGVPVVQVGQERVVRRAEVLPVQVQRVLVQVVLEPHQHGLAVLGVDPGTGERAVEAVDRRRRQGADRARGVGGAVRVEGRHGLAERVDRQHLRRRERVRPDEQVELVDDRVGEPDGAGPELVGLVAEGVLLTDARTGRQRQRRDLGRRQRSGRRRDRQGIGEGGEDQRADRERLDVDRVRQGDRRGAEDAVGVHQPPGRQGRLHQDLRGANTDDGGPHGPRSQHVAARNPGAFRLQAFLDMGHYGQPPVVRVPAPTVGGSLAGLSRVRTAAIDEGSEEDALNARGAASPEAGRDLASQVVTPLAAAAQRAVTAHPGCGGRAVTRTLGRAPGSSTHLCACSGNQSMSHPFFRTPPLISAKTHPKIGEEAP